MSHACLSEQSLGHPHLGCTEHTLKLISDANASPWCCNKIWAQGLTLLEWYLSPFKKWLCAVWWEMDAHSVLLPCACAALVTILFHSSLKKAKDIWCEVVSTWLIGWCEIRIFILMETIMNNLVWNFDISSFALLRVIVKNVACSLENS